MKTTVNQLSENTSKTASERFNVIYVDDEEINLRVFRNAFKKYYNLYTATTGTEALEIIEKETIHMIITDQKMTDMNGVELLKKVVTINPEIIRIMLSGCNDMKVIISAVNEAKIAKYLTKPWDQEVLKETMDGELKKFAVAEALKLDELPRITFQSRIGKEEFDKCYSSGDQLSKVFNSSFEINNYPDGSQSNFQWVGQSADGHKVILLINTMLHKANDIEIKRGLSEKIEGIVKEQNSCNHDIITKVSKSYKELVSVGDQYKNDGFDLSICALFVHEVNDTLQYFSNYHGLKLFDLSYYEYEDGMYSGFYRVSAVSKIFVFSSTFNAHCLGELTYSQLINESIEMDLERQGHFLEMEVINSHLTEFNVTIVGIELNEAKPLNQAN
ncbi:MAG: response regulator [Bacteroidota bacterium]